MRFLLVPLACFLIATSGCGRDPRAEVPGHLNPGKVSDVVEQMDGNSGGNQIEHMGKVPNGEWVPPNIAVLNSAEVRYGWFVPRLSRDEESERYGHWVAVKVRESSFRRQNDMSDALYLNGLEEVEIGPDGSLRGKVMQHVRPEPSRSSAIDTPYVPAGDQTQVTVVVDDGRGPARVVDNRTVPTRPLGGNDAERVQQVVDDIRSRMNSSTTGPISPAPPIPAPGAPAGGDR